MKIANVKGFVTKAVMVALAAGTLMFAGAASVQAQRFAVGVQVGQPAYQYDRNDYRYDRNDYRYRDNDRRRDEAREREQREEFARRQAYLQHERWEHQQWERAHHFDHDYDYR